MTLLQKIGPCFFARYKQLSCLPTRQDTASVEQAVVLPRRADTQASTRRGSAAVEFALTAPFLFLIVFGIVEFGRMTMVRNALTNAAREGCRRAVLATTVDRNEIDALVRRYVNGVVSVEDVRVSISPENFAAVASESQVTVSVRVNYSDISWLPIGGLAGDSVLQATSTQRRE